LPASEVPWFWSVQYDLKLQIADRTPDSDRTVLRGYSRQAKFAVFHLRGKALHAVEAVNAPGEFMGVRQLIGKPLAIDIEALANPMITMKHVAI
jgi:3-phenylpropionate/trans-cinnamate dioxygenase ferredoxin reductase subunit